MPVGARPSWATLRQAGVWHGLRDALDAVALDAVALDATAARRAAGGALDVVDAGGGSGGFAVPLAQLGHRVLVIDPSPDSLASLERRAAEAGVGHLVTARQGDLASLADLVPAGGADVLLCHGVLEVVDDPAEAMAAVAAALRPGGLLSLLAANRAAVVLARTMAGRFREAATALSAPDGRSGPYDGTRRRFDRDQLTGLATDAGLTVRSVHGVRVFVDLVPGGLLDADPGAADALLQLELAAADQPPFRDLATQLHLLADR